MLLDVLSNPKPRHTFLVFVVFDAESHGLQRIEPKPYECDCGNVLTPEELDLGDRRVAVRLPSTTTKQDIAPAVSVASCNAPEDDDTKEVVDIIGIGEPDLHALNNCTIFLAKIRL